MTEDELIGIDLKTMNIHAKFVIGQRLFQGVAKTKKKNGLKYDYLAVANVGDESIRVLNLININTYIIAASYVQEGNRTQVEIVRRFVNIDNPEESFEIPSAGFGIDNQDKGIGKALSYADKNLFIRLFFIGGEDVEADQTTTHNQNPPATAAELKDLTAWLTEQKISKAELEEWLKKGKWACTFKELSVKRIEILKGIENLADVMVAK